LATIGPAGRCPRLVRAILDLAEAVDRNAKAIAGNVILDSIHQRAKHDSIQLNDDTRIRAVSGSGINF